LASDLREGGGRGESEREGRNDEEKEGNQLTVGGKAGKLTGLLE